MKQTPLAVALLGAAVFALVCAGCFVGRPAAAYAAGASVSTEMGIVFVEEPSVSGTNSEEPGAPDAATPKPLPSIDSAGISSLPTGDALARSAMVLFMLAVAAVLVSGTALWRMRVDGDEKGGFHVR